MARTKEQETESLPLVSETADVHHIVRTIAAQDVPGGPIGPDTADAVIRGWLQQGYKLHTVVPMQTVDFNGVWAAQVLYIVIRD